MNKFSNALVAFSTAVLMVGCGGGGGDAGTSPFVTDDPSTNSSAAHLTLQLSSSSILNGGTATVTATATATTSSGQAVAGIPVTFSVDNGASFTQSSATTSATGQAAATVSIGADPSNRVITVTASTGSLTATAPFAVTGTMLTATGSAVVAPSSAGTVSFRLTDANGAAIAGQGISVVAGTLGSSTGTTGINGDFVFTYTAPAAGGSIDVVGTAGGVTKSLTVLVQSGSGSIPAAVGPISSASVSANPSVVSTNSTSTSNSNRTEIRALFVGPSNTPIARVRVKFDTNGDPNSIGGTFSTGSSVIYSDANGVATTAFIPGDRASPTNGVTIRACYDIVDFTGCPNAATATITVVSDPISVSIGSNNVIVVGPTNLTYRRQFVVLVVDASGRAKANVDIVPSIDLPIFFKGYFAQSGTAFVRTPSVGCLNEDLNRNGILESSESNPNANTPHVGNHSADTAGQPTITPRKADTTITILGTGKTDDSGSAIVQIEYPQSVANWLQVNIQVSATGVSGTEGRATWTEILPIPVDTLAGPATPPFVTSPYGVITANASPNNLTNQTDPAKYVNTFPDGAPGTAGVITGQTTVAPCNNAY